MKLNSLESGLIYVITILLKSLSRINLTMISILWTLVKRMMAHKALTFLKMIKCPIISDLIPIMNKFIKTDRLTVLTL
jgi:hypothetical protein